MTFNQEYINVDKIIDTALKDYKEKLEKIDIKDWSIESQSSYIERTYEEYKYKSIAYINKAFPDDNSNPQNLVNNNSRFLLYSYTAKRDNEFDKIRDNFIKKTNL